MVLCHSRRESAFAFFVASFACHSRMEFAVVVAFVFAFLLVSFEGAGL
jgi:hypothetical protein